jgi:two-component system chemotaxis response regulator CheB
MLPDKNGKIKVLVVDDSAFMRVALRNMMEKDSKIEVVDVARNGEEAISKIEKKRPDLVTMDIEMPVMDGLSALDKIMKDMPLPVIMISALTEEGADATFRALDLGAVDFIPKGGKSYVNLDIVKVGEQLRQKIRAIVARDRLKRMRHTSTFGFKKDIIEDRHRERNSKQRIIDRKCHIVVIGVSTGGPLALNRMLPKIPSHFSSSILIVQHMPPTFTGPFARRLDTLSQISVKEAEDGEAIEVGCAYIAPGGIHMKVKKRSNGQFIRLDPQPEELLFVPSVDVMMESITCHFSKPILGVIMTGMGSDGLNGMSQIKEKGGVTLAQDEDSCVVYGMPRVCVEKGIIDHIVSLDIMAEEITHLAG